MVFGRFFDHFSHQLGKIYLVVTLKSDYGLIKQRKDAGHALKLSLKSLNDESSLEKYLKARGKLLDDKIDVTGYIVEKIEEYGSRLIRC